MPELAACQLMMHFNLARVIFAWAAENPDEAWPQCSVLQDACMHLCQHLGCTSSSCSHLSSIVIVLTAVSQCLLLHSGNERLPESASDMPYFDICDFMDEDMKRLPLHRVIDIDRPEVFARQIQQVWGTLEALRLHALVMNGREKNKASLLFEDAGLILDTVMHLLCSLQAVATMPRQRRLLENIANAVPIVKNLTMLKMWMGELKTSGHLADRLCSCG